MNSLKKMSQLDWIITSILVIYIISGIVLPVSELIDTQFGMALTVLLAFSSFYFFNVVIGILFILSAYLLIVRSKKETGTQAISDYVSTEESKYKDMKNMNYFPKTVEEEVVAKMTPMVAPAPLEPASYQPLMNDKLEFSLVNEQ